MKCIEDDIIQKYIDKEISVNEAMLIESHLATCSKCKQKYIEHKNLCNEMIQSLNEGFSQHIYIPPFKYPKSTKRSLKSTYKKMVYAISAASIIAFAYFFLTNTNAGSSEKMYVNSYDEIFDANKTISQQGIMITIIDPKGDIKEVNLK